ncbi:DUF6152 family protein [Gammaproteobacteria bacterium]|nr:DUF6152 family protein [Gammaproteobacteria bacterium]
MTQFGKSILAASITLALAAPASAHHSAAAFNTQEETTATGTIIEYSFRNPHVYMTLAVEQDDGSIVEMEVEAGAGSVINPLGFTRDSVAVGDVVTVAGNPGRRRPNELMLGRELYKQDGTYYPLNISSRSVYEESDETATSLNGTWFSPRSSFFAFLGGSRGWSATEKGQQAMANTNPLETPQKDCIPIAAPALMFYPVANTITVEDDKVVINVDWMGSERTVYLDGREHPAASETFLHGHSIGHWEDDTLVIDTSNYSEHPMGLSTSLPGSTQKHLTERLSVNEDGKGVTYAGVMVDPEYLAEPVEWSGQWLYRPQMSHSNEVCDLEVARRFLDD